MSLVRVFIIIKNNSHSFFFLFSAQFLSTTSPKYSYYILSYATANLYRRDSSSGRASASCAVGQDGCRIDTLAASYQRRYKNGTSGYLAWRSAL